MSLLTVKFLKQIDRLQIRSQEIFRGKFKGERRSLNRGASVEFADYRLYELGDDLRYIDWNIYARLDRLFLKLFRAEEDLPIHILLDNSRSMDFGEPTKLECAKRIAAALSYIGLASLDRVSIYTLSNQANLIVPLTYGKTQFAKLSKGIEGIGEAQGTTDLTASLKRFVTNTRQPGVALIISDFLDMNGYEPGLKLLFARNFDVMVIHLLSDEEINPRLSGELRLEDAETGQSKEMTINEQALVGYRVRFNAFCEGLKRFCLNRGVTYVRFNNRMPLEPFVLQELRRIGFIR